ncbi:MAG: sugar phosphate isomerase/epimerase [Candidatus Omnitrophica bacterium]|jgi:inosose dehydratase|nr:sugar phosphate isomerase/epimerase [Candidatus Omnitrophota bacterium]
MAGYKIGCHTLTWGNFLRDYPLKNALCEIKEAGYDGVEMYDALERLGPAASFRTQLSEVGLELASLSANIRVTSDEKSDTAEAREKAYFAGQFGVKALMVTGGWKGDGLSKDVKSYKALCKRLDSLAEYSSGFNVRIAFHNHLDTIVEEERDIASLLEFSRSVKLCVDTGHLAAAGSDPAGVIERYRSSVALVHLKDWDPRARDFSELGRGILCHNMKNILASLDKINYTGWIVVELDRTSTTPFESARMSRGFLRGIGY